MVACIWPLKLSYNCQRQLDSCVNHCPDAVQSEQISGMNHLLGGKVSSNPCRDHCYDQANRCHNQKPEPVAEPDIPVAEPGF